MKPVLDSNLEQERQKGGNVRISQCSNEIVKLNCDPSDVVSGDINLIIHVDNCGFTVYRFLCLIN